MNSNLPFYYFSESKTIHAKSDHIHDVDELFWQNGSGSFSEIYIYEKCGISPRNARSILNQYYRKGLLEKKITRECPYDDCSKGIYEEDFKSPVCPHCGKELSKEWRKKPTLIRFILNRKGRQFSPWLMLLHGMNTEGEWQQDSVYRFGLYNEHSPFKIYKYGIRRIEPFFKLLQNKRVSKFIKDYKQASKEARQCGINDPPDIIAHSFGTLILVRAMERDKAISFGRVLLCGSIIRPDFDWLKYKREGRVDLILNHFGGKDFWAHIAVYAIPRSGPSGRIGFVEMKETRDYIFNVKYPAYKHSDFFKDDNFPQQFKFLWRPFLWGRLDELKGVIELHNGVRRWKLPPFLFRGIIIRLSLVLILIVLVIILI